MSSRCPICKSTGSPLAGAVRTFVRQSKSIISSQYAYCPHCDFGFNATPPSQEELTAYYVSNDQFRRREITPEEVSHISGQVAFVAPYLSMGAKTLEIGADNGSFLSILNDQTGSGCYFDELNPAAVEILRENGFADVRDMLDGSKFDCIVARHVFEHVSDPIEFLIEQRDRLKDDGVIFFEVPDCTAMGMAETDDFQFEHISYFSANSMTRIARKSGFLVEALQFTSTPGYSTTPNRVMRVVLKKCAIDKAPTSHHWQRRLDKTNEQLLRIEDALTAHAKSRVALYGTGTITMAFLAYTQKDWKFVRIFDADPKKQGTALFGIEISSPADIAPSDFDCILVTVVGYETEVLRVLHSKGVKDNQIILLSTLRGKQNVAQETAR